MAYEIALHPATLCDAAARDQAEIHYRHALELVLGGADAVCDALRTVRSLDDVPFADLTDEQCACLKSWLIADARARVSGAADLPDSPTVTVTFKVRLCE